MQVKCLAKNSICSNWEMYSDNIILFYKCILTVHTVCIGYTHRIYIFSGRKWKTNYSLLNKSCYALIHFEYKTHVKTNIFSFKNPKNWAEIPFIGAYNLKNQNVPSSRLQNVDITIEFCSIELVENELFAISSFYPIFAVWKIKNFWVFRKSQRFRRITFGPTSYIPIKISYHHLVILLLKHT